MQQIQLYLIQNVVHLDVWMKVKSENQLNVSVNTDLNSNPVFINFDYFSADLLSITFLNMAPVLLHCTCQDVCFSIRFGKVNSNFIYSLTSQF